MKKIYLLLLPLLLLSITPVRADEGMWLLPLLEKLNSKKMSELGLKLTAKDIYDINKSCLKDAVVHFGSGCTGEIVSKDGLLLTNHHCGYGAIQKLSSVEHDYLENGYWAMNRSQELPAPGLTVTFLESFTDVTSEVMQALADCKSTQEKKIAFDKISKQLIEQSTKGDKYLEGTVKSFYADNAFYLIITKTYSDIRFVGAPPSSIGKFGADTDNWMWPRHTCDFSMFRVYAGKDNNPAPYSPENVPYQPKKFLTISLKGVEQNDFSMIIGYPGRTSRFMTSAEVNQTSNISNAIRIYARGIRQDILMKDMLSDPKIRLQYASKYASSSNAWKKAIGMNETFKKLNVEQRRAEEEKAFTEWVNADGERVKKYGSALDNIYKSVAERADALYVYTYLSETIANIEIATLALNYFTVLDAVSKGDIDGAKKIAESMKEQVDNYFTNYSAATDRKVTKAMIKVFREKVKSEFLPSFYSKIDKDFGGNVDAYVDFIFDNSLFTTKEGISKAINSDFSNIMNDPAIILAKSINDVLPSIRMELASKNALYAKGCQDYIAGQLEMKKDKAMYPDANSTMRLSYGKILNYSPKDGILYQHYTTLKGVMEKEDPDNWEFVVPAKLKELYKNKDYGQYALSNGEMPVAFISNNDITGGNSGSPIMNAKGELTGLAFDGNWEAMSGDIIFEPNLQRTICVDIRYVLFIMDKFGGAGYLLKEMNIAK